MGLLDTIRSVLGTGESASTESESPTDDKSKSPTDDEPKPETADRSVSEAADSQTENATDSERTEQPDTQSTDKAVEDSEADFDHLTTQTVDDGPDMADDAAELITEAETDDADPDVGDASAVGTIPDDDPRIEFVEAADELAEFWGEYDLDFALESLTRLDDLVDEQWDPDRFEDVEFGDDGYDAEVYTETATQLGSYFGEVLVRQHDGTWQQETATGWTVAVQSGPDSEAAGATVAVFQVAEDCLTGGSTFTGMHDALADRLNLAGRAGDGDTPVDLDRADIETVVSDAEIDDAAERLRGGAEDLAARWSEYDLDFSVASLDRLDTLLEAELERDRFADVELGDETDQESMLLTAHVVGVAGYLAEVLRRQRDAEWDDMGRMVLVVEHDDSRTRVDPIEVAIAAVRDRGSLTAAVPDTRPDTDDLAE